MSFFYWLSINFFKSQSINILFSILNNGLILLIEFYLLMNLRGVSYSIKQFLPERHLNKNTIPHLGGLILISTFLIQWNLLKINNIILNFIVYKNIYSLDVVINLWKNNEIVRGLISHYIFNMGVILFIKTIILNFYLNLKNNQWGLYEKSLLLTPFISGIINAFHSYYICFSGGFSLFPVQIKSILLISYLPIVYLWKVLIGYLIVIVLGYLINGKYNRSSTEIIQRTKKYLIISLVMIVFIWLAINSVLFLNIYYNVQSIFSFENLMNFFQNIFLETFVLIFFPMILGSIDDIEKINNNIIKIPNKIKFISFLFFGMLFNNHNFTLFHGLLQHFLKKINNIWIVNGIFFLLKGLLFNSIINAFNFTDGADGLLFLSSIGSLLGFLFIQIFYLYKIFISNINNLHIIFNKFYFITSNVVFIIFFFIFFLFNKKPAKIFLGETGSFGVAIVFIYLFMSNGLDFFLFLSFFMGFVQLFSTTIQAISFKTFKKRVFLMSPFHHHLELLGYSDSFILTLFVLINTLGLSISLLIYLNYSPLMLLNLIKPYLFK